MLKKFKDKRTGQIFIPTGRTEIARMEASKNYEEVKKNKPDSEENKPKSDQSK